MTNPQIYSSEEDNKIFIKNPPFLKQSHYKLKSWTETVLGYQNEARKLTTCLIRNRKLLNEPYRWAIHINHNEEISPDIVKEIWKKACRVMSRKGIDGFWVREPNKINKVHYHMIVLNNMTKKELADIIEAAMPNRKEFKWRKRIEPMRHEWNFCHYITKCKVKGMTKTGRLSNDIYAPKRLLFKPHLRFRKLGSIGDFWVRPRKVLWEEIKEAERKIAEGFNDPRLKKLTEHVYDWLGGTVCKKKIERSFAKHAKTEATQRWMDKLFEDNDLVNSGHGLE